MAMATLHRVAKLNANLFFRPVYVNYIRLLLLSQFTSMLQQMSFIWLKMREEMQKWAEFLSCVVAKSSRMVPCVIHDANLVITAYVDPVCCSHCSAETTNTGAYFLKKTYRRGVGLVALI